MAREFQQQGLRRTKNGQLTTRQITHGDLDSLPGSSLRTSSKIIAEPRDISRERWVQRTRRDEDTRVYEPWHAATRDTHDKADSHDAQAYKDERIPLANSIAEPRDNNSQDGGGDINGYGEELGCGRGISECADDGWEEEGYAV